jgi:predicted nucleic acid-binding protein
MIVIDASVAVKWFRVDEPDRDQALAVLERVAQRPQEFAVPELFFNEMLAVLARLDSLGTAELLEALSLLEQLGLERLGNGHELLRLAARLSRQLGLTGYDATYLASARLLQGRWLTADRRAQRLVRQEREVLLLDDWT